MALMHEQGYLSDEEYEEASNYQLVIAEDTGGNIKGNTIDIYMNSASECRKWGVRTVTIYIE